MANHKPQAANQVSTKPAVEAVKKSFLAYNIAKDAEVAHRIPVTIPGLGDTGEALFVRSMYCKQYRDAEQKGKRQMAALMTTAEGGQLDPELIEDITMTVFCALVEGWTFEEEAHADNLKLFFASNPHMYDAVNTEAAKHANFFKVSAPS